MPPYYFHRHTRTRERELIRARRRRHRFTTKQRTKRIYDFIYTRTRQNRPATLQEISRHENLSPRRTKLYIKLINERLRKQSVGLLSIETLRTGKTIRFVYFQRPEPEPLKPIDPQQATLAVTLSLKYESFSHASRNLYVKGWVLVSASGFHDPQVLAAQSALRYGIERVLGQKILQLCDIGFDRGVDKYHAPKFLGYSHQPNGPWTPIEI